MTECELFWTSSPATFRSGDLAWQVPAPRISFTPDMHKGNPASLTPADVDEHDRRGVKFKKIKKSSQTLLRFVVVPHRSRPPNATGQ
jgi:hypothetical protein